MRKELNRRSFLGKSASAVGAALLPVDAVAAATRLGESSARTPGALDQYAAAYLRTMHAPGMTVGLISADQSMTHAYGYSNAEGKIAVDVAQPFWIGSICKSFVGIVAMQLRDEGKLDIHKPVLEIMPDLPFTEEFGRITTHHLLTHTSGLPNWLQLFASSPGQRARQAYAPGTRFAYCNLGYDTLGLLIAHLDGRSWPESVTARILKPLGMSGSSGQIDDAVQAQMPVGYHYQYRDRPCSVVDPLVAVGYVAMSNAAGSIAAPAGDMCKYMRMLIERGRGPAGRIVSEEGYKLFSTPYFKAPVLSANASYGYGIGVETIDGHTTLRHTGGATAFASSILVDLEGGVGAFASINSMQGYRPNPVTRYALDLLHAGRSGSGAPPVPLIDDPLAMKDPEAFAGRYRSAAGDVVNLVAKGAGLVITTALGTSSLRPLGGDLFSAADESVLHRGGQAHVPSAFALMFERTKVGDGTAAPVTGLSYGSQRFENEHHGVPAAVVAKLPGADRYTGAYSNDSPWSGLVRVVERGGKLWMDGTDELHSIKDDRFAVEGDEGTLELTFVSYLQGRAQMVEMDGQVFRRVTLATAG